MNMYIKINFKQKKDNLYLFIFVVSEVFLKKSKKKQLAGRVTIFIKLRKKIFNLDLALSRVNRERSLLNSSKYYTIINFYNVF